MPFVSPENDGARKILHDTFSFSALQLKRDPRGSSHSGPFEVFSESAELYDLIYSRIKDYPAEARHLVDLLGRVHAGCCTMLDVACGTGEHACLLAAHHGFEVDGLDLLLERAAAEAPSVSQQCQSLKRIPWETCLWQQRVVRVPRSHGRSFLACCGHLVSRPCLSHIA